MRRTASELLKDLEIRIAKLEKQSKRFNLSDEYAISLHKDLLTWLKNISKRTITYDNYDEFRSKLMGFGGEIFSIAFDDIKGELEGIERGARANHRESKGYSYEEYTDYLHFEKGMYEDDAIEYADLNYIDDKEMDEILKITTVFKEKINIFSDINRLILDMPSLPERDVPSSESEIRYLLRMNNRSEYEIDEYISQNPPRTQKEQDQIGMDGWFVGADKWLKKVQNKSREGKKILQQLVTALNSIGEKIGLTENIEETMNINGFNVVLVNYGDSENDDESLSNFKKALNIYQKNTQKRFSLLSQINIPILILFSLDTRTSWNGRTRKVPIDVGAFYNKIKKEITITSTTLGNIKDLTHTIAHEHGHHIYTNYLSNRAKDFWDTAINQDYTGKLEIKNVIDFMEKLNINYFDEIPKNNPILFLQLSVLNYKNPDIMDLDDLKDLYREGKRHLRVPKTPISYYASENTEEAFCEAIGMFVTYGTRAVHPLVLSWLSNIIDINI
tara:strand:+ start:44 stop:1549 length:1506 start_codon:yes stop_codon:yes gene_type:complete